MTSVDYRPRRRSILAATTALACSVPVAAHATGPTPPSDDPSPSPRRERAAQADSATFSTSYEDDDPQLDWLLEPEPDAQGAPRVDGIIGPTPTGMPGSLATRIATVTASAENGPSESARMAADDTPETKWLAFEPTGWLQYEMDAPVTAKKYRVTSGNDAPDRDPNHWRLSGSSDGKDWTLLDERKGAHFAARHESQDFDIDAPGEYRFYRFEVVSVVAGNLLQVADVTLSDGSAHAEPAESMVVEVGRGPRNGYAAAQNVGFTGVRSLFYGGRVTGADGGSAWMRLHQVSIPVAEDTELSYRIFPEFSDDLTYASTWTAVDLHFTDGTYLSDLHAADQYGFQCSPRGQGQSKALYTRQWNHRAIRLGSVAAGKTIDRILLACDIPHADVEFSGWIDDITIAERPLETHDRPSDWVDTRRGSHSSSSFSRGLTFPATAVPHGFNFFTPVTDAGSVGSPYAYHHHNDEENRIRLQALAFCHAPSPWMGDRQIFQVMPVSADGAPPVRRRERSLAFSHDTETAHPHLYSVTCDSGLTAEIAPTAHAAIMRFRFPDQNAHLVFDNARDTGGLTLQDDGVVIGWSDTRSGLSAGATRMYFYGRVDAKVTAHDVVPGDPGGEVTGYMSLDVGEERTVTLRIASSLLSVEQAQRNLDLEVSEEDTLESVAGRAQDLWDEKLGIIEVEGASADQLRTLYSNLYRLSLYPNIGHENIGSADRPIWAYASPVSPSESDSTPTETGASIVEGTIYVNNGFWDTYRTAWPAYALFLPEDAPGLIDGFVQQYRDGGWIARWSSPGYANLMTGTSSDVAFADAAVKGIPLVDPQATYEAGLRNATVLPDPKNPNDPSVGRKGMDVSPFLGWTTTDVSEGTSWGLEGCINDFALARQAELLAADKKRPAAERARLTAEATYLHNRSLMYAEMFDRAVGFFQGRARDGSFRRPPAEYDPREWGMHDYTETDGWNFAFHAPFDGEGLAALHGGRAALAKKLDDFYATPETGTFPGTYGGVIHEVREARDVRMGQWGFSNQVSHHIPFTYIVAGQPSKTQAITREVLSRCFLGSDLGQGYAGDEDNGETSAWWLFTAMGLYPYQLGSGTYAITSPLFTRATITPPGGKPITVIAHKNSARNIYIQALTVNGEPWNRAWIEHDRLAAGATLEFTMGAEPSDWATSAEALPPAPSDGAPAARHDLLGHGALTADGLDVTALTDDDATSDVELPLGTQLSVSFEKPVQITQYTITSATAETAPHGWVLESSPNLKVWKTIDERHGEEFRWDRQVRPFTPASPNGAKRHFRLRILDGAGQTVRIAEVELIGG